MLSKTITGIFTFFLQKTPYEMTLKAYVDSININLQFIALCRSEALYEPEIETICAICGWIGLCIKKQCGNSIQR